VDFGERDNGAETLGYAFDGYEGEDAYEVSGSDLKEYEVE
jgi:hypothetical protein